METKKPRLTITEAQDMVRNALGADYVPVNLSGYWIIHRYDKDGRLTSGPLSQSRSLPRAIEMARQA